MCRLSMNFFLGYHRTDIVSQFFMVRNNITIIVQCCVTALVSYLLAFLQEILRTLQWSLVSECLEI